MDEKEARHVLVDMQAKIARSAYDALNITAGDVGPEHVRAAFLQLTKQFHPAKFARMAPEIQKLANEVFLGLRAAHDQLGRPKTAPPTARQSQQMHIIKPPGASNNASGIRPAPTAGTAVPVRNAPPPPTAALNPPTQRGVQPAPATVSTTPQRGVAAQPPAARPPIQTGQQPPQARPPMTTTATRTGVAAPPIRRNTPPGGIPVAAKQPTPAGGTPAAKPGAAAGAEPELVSVYDQLQKGQFEQARTTLNALIALQPKPRYRALLAYSVGREAQLANRRDEARVDLHNALEIDPELQLAKTALAELFTRRK